MFVALETESDSELCLEFCLTVLTGEVTDVDVEGICFEGDLGDRSGEEGSFSLTPFLLELLG